MFKTTATIILALIPLFAHEQEAHISLSKTAVTYIQQMDPIRYQLLQPYNLLLVLPQGAYNEDNFFDPAPCTSSSSFSDLLVHGYTPTGPCYLGRFYFHFLEQPNMPANNLGQSANCSSKDWGLDGGASCTASTAIPLFGSSPPMQNQHSWNVAVSNIDPITKAPTLDGWKHLGYVIHLLEDLTSPPHTRNSGHPCALGWFCEPFEKVNGEPFQAVSSPPPPINFPLQDYLQLGVVTSAQSIFDSVQRYTHDHYFSTRTAFNGDGPLASAYDDLFYYYGTCVDVPASVDFGTCKPVSGQMLRKIAHKGVAWYASGGFPNFADIDVDIAREQFAELGPVTVQAVAALIDFYAPMLTVNIQGNGTGKITSNPGTINCTSTSTSGPNCAALFVQGTPVTLTATADPGFTFSGWGGGCSGSAGTVQITLTSDQSCTATFGALTSFGSASVTAKTMITRQSDSDSRSMIDMKPPGSLSAAAADTDSFQTTGSPVFNGTTRVASSVSLLPDQPSILTISSMLNVTGVCPYDACEAFVENITSADAQDDFLLISGPAKGTFRITFTVNGTLSATGGVVNAFVDWSFQRNYSDGYAVFDSVRLPFVFSSTFRLDFENGTINVSNRTLTADVTYTRGVMQHLEWNLSSGGTSCYWAPPCTANLDFDMKLTGFKVLDEEGNEVSNVVIRTGSGYNYLSLH